MLVGDREEAGDTLRLNEMTADQRRNLNYSISRAQYNAVTEVHMHTAEGGCLIRCHLQLLEVVRKWFHFLV